MKFTRWAAGFTSIAAALATAVAFGGANGHAERTVQSVHGVPAVVAELFTSEGCSSCPPADAVLLDLENNQPVIGAHVIALEEHVDYWNNKSWRDPFSAASYSARQNDYALTFHNSQIYTPQMIVDGQTEFVGSDGDRANAEIRRVARELHAVVSLTASRTRETTADELHLQVNVSGAPHAGNADIYVALTEDGLSSQVKGGENSGRHLKHAAIVRKLVKIGGLSSQTGVQSFETTLQLPAGVSLSTLRAAAFVQQTGAGKIVGAADASLAGLGPA